MLARRIDLDFVLSPPRPWLGYGVLVLGIALLVHSADAWRDRERHVTKAHESLDRLRRAAYRPLPAAVVPATAVVRLAAVERELHRPWHGLLAALERAQMTSVQLLSIEPDAATGRVLVTALTPAFRNITDYGQNLERNGLRDVVLQSHQRIGDPPAQPFRFVYVARWAEAQRRSPEATVK